MFHNHFLKSPHFLFLLLTMGIQWGLATYSEHQKQVLFENCAVFNNRNFYGGEICGTNGKNYANSMFLNCINYSEKTGITTAHPGSCRSGREYCDPNLLYSPVCGSDNKTRENVQALMCYNHKKRTNVTIKSYGECSQIDYCYRNSIDQFGLNPVCASNGYTYQNAGQVKCLQKYSSTGLRILHDGGCHVNEVYAIYGNGDIVCGISRERYEWNPLCGEDGKTYPNPFIFLCHKPCLKVYSNTECSTTSHNACVTAHKNTIKINGVLINADFDINDEVCGSDGKTYRSSYHLQCQSLRNKYLTLRHSGPCVGPDDSPCGALSTQESIFPVCATDRITYISPEALFCAHRRTPERKISFLHDGPC